MKSKEKGWVSNLLNWGRERQMSAHERLYGAAIEIARRPDLFAKYGVSDDVDGRFDALALVVSLVMRRLKELGDDGRNLSQQLFDQCLPTWISRFGKWGQAILASQNVSGSWLRPLWAVLMPILRRSTIGTEKRLPRHGTQSAARRGITGCAPERIG